VSANEIVEPETVPIALAPPSRGASACAAGVQIPSASKTNAVTTTKRDMARLLRSATMRECLER